MRRHSIVLLTDSSCEFDHLQFPPEVQVIPCFLSECRCDSKPGVVLYCVKQRELSEDERWKENPPRCSSMWLPLSSPICSPPHFVIYETYSGTWPRRPGAYLLEKFLFHKMKLETGLGQHSHNYLLTKFQWEPNGVITSHCFRHLRYLRNLEFLSADSTS